MTIECDAGMCRVFFHVTWLVNRLLGNFLPRKPVKSIYTLCYSGQREGLLAEATHEEVDEQADPFYAHCKLHSDKNEIKYENFYFLPTMLTAA